VEAVHAAAAWYRKSAIHGYDYEHPRLIPRAGAGPIWARFYEIGTNRPIFSNRDGRILYRYEELDEERRTGYAWFRTGAASVLETYEKWQTRHPAAR
jgi:PelA/Pel-15E family pectate lyase